MQAQSDSESEAAYEEPRLDSLTTPVTGPRSAKSGTVWVANQAYEESATSATDVEKVEGTVTLTDEVKDSSGKEDTTVKDGVVGKKSEIIFFGETESKPEADTSVESETDYENVLEKCLEDKTVDWERESSEETKSDHTEEDIYAKKKSQLHVAWEDETQYEYFVIKCFVSLVCVYFSFVTCLSCAPGSHLCLILKRESHHSSLLKISFRRKLEIIAVNT